MRKGFQAGRAACAKVQRLVGEGMALSELQGCGLVPARLRETTDEAVELSWAPVMEAHETQRKSLEA